MSGGGRERDGERGTMTKLISSNKLAIDEQAQDTRPNREEIIECLRLYREKDDRSKWQAGDVAAAWLEMVEHGSQMTELASLAEASGYVYGGLKERYDCSQFWPPESRRWGSTGTPETEESVITWSHYNRARRGTDLAGAIARLEYADSQSLTVTAFEKWLQGKSGNSTLLSELDSLMAKITRICERQDLNGSKPYLESAYEQLRKAREKELKHAA